MYITSTLAEQVTFEIPRDDHLTLLLGTLHYVL